MAIYPKGENWFIDYRVDGRRKREKIGPSKRLAREVLSKRLAEIAERKHFPERKREFVRFSSFMDIYWERHWQYLRAKGKQSVRRGLVVAFGGKSLDRISCGVIQDFYNQKRADTSAATANRYLARLAHIFGRAKKWRHYYGENPAADVEKGREENYQLRFLSEDEIVRLLGKCSSAIYPVVACALFTGMRRGEILGRRWENINLAQGIIYILSSKSGKSREIPIVPQLAAVLVSLGPKKDGPIFRVSEATLKRHFERALKSAEIGPFRFHALRHTFASHFVMRTGDLPALQRILGHSSLKMTQRYAHLSKKHLASEMELFAKGMPGGK